MRFEVRGATSQDSPLLKTGLSRGRTPLFLDENLLNVKEPLQEKGFTVLTTKSGKRDPEILAEDLPGRIFVTNNPRDLCIQRLCLTSLSSTPPTSPRTHRTWRDILETLTFADDKVTPPLQAADMMADIGRQVAIAHMRDKVTAHDSSLNSSIYFVRHWNESKMLEILAHQLKTQDLRV